MQSIKSKYIVGILLAIMVGFFIPFFLKSQDDSWISVLSLSFTILGSIITVTTLFIAILLFDRFGINAKFKEKQVDKVLELVMLLETTSMTATTNKWRYFVHYRKAKILKRYDFAPYKVDSTKFLLFPTNLEVIFKDIQIIRNSYWLPKEIKDKMKFLEIYGLNNVDNPLDEQYIRLDINSNGTEPWMISFPKITFEMLYVNMFALLQEIEVWLKRHSNVPIGIEL